MRESMGERFEWIWISDTAKDALDFHLACHLGEGLAQMPQAEFVIISNDKKGFDLLLKHLKSRGIKCRREGKAQHAKPLKKSTLKLDASSIRTVLLEIEKNKRPRRRATLMNYLVTHFNKKFSEMQITDSIVSLIDGEHIAESDGKLTYNF